MYETNKKFEFKMRVNRVSLSTSKRSGGRSDRPLLKLALETFNANKTKAKWIGKSFEKNQTSEQNSDAWPLDTSKRKKSNQYKIIDAPMIEVSQTYRPSTVARTPQTLYSCQRGSSRASRISHLRDSRILEEISLVVYEPQNGDPNVSCAKHPPLVKQSKRTVAAGLLLSGIGAAPYVQPRRRRLTKELPSVSHYALLPCDRNYNDFNRGFASPSLRQIASLACDSDEQLSVKRGPRESRISRVSATAVPESPRPRPSFVTLSAMTPQQANISRRIVQRHALLREIGPSNTSPSPPELEVLARINSFCDEDRTHEQNNLISPPPEPVKPSRPPLGLRGRKLALQEKIGELKKKAKNLGHHSKEIKEEIAELQVGVQLCEFQAGIKQLSIENLNSLFRLENFTCPFTFLNDNPGVFPRIKNGRSRWIGLIEQCLAEPSVLNTERDLGYYSLVIEGFGLEKLPNLDTPYYDKEEYVFPLIFASKILVDLEYHHLL